MPVPATEPRRQLKLRLQLQRSADCEEQFDLALYSDPGVELVAWAAASDACRDREVVVRYLPGRTSLKRILTAARAAAVEVTRGHTQPAAEVQK